MKILFLANLIPYPLDGGGKIFTFSVLEALSKYNEIDILCFYEHEDVKSGYSALSKYCNNMIALPIRVTTKENKAYMIAKAGISLFSSKPLAVSKYYTLEMKKTIKSFLMNNHYDSVFINLLAMGVYLDTIKKTCPNIKVILYEQNCESLIYNRLLEQEKRLFYKQFIKKEYIKLNRFEQTIIKKVDKVIVLSDEDRKNLNLVDAEIVPIGVMPQTYKKTYLNGVTQKVKMVFIGTMTWAPNNEGIIWFINNVMPLCSDGELYDLTIVGKNPSEKLKSIAEKYSNIHIKGYVENLEEVYDEADVLIVPLFVGSGQRVKIIEAFARNIAVISTTIGAEGLEYIDNQTIMIADTPEGFKKKIDKCRDKSFLGSVAAGAYNVFKTTYSTEVISKKLNEIIK